MSKGDIAFNYFKSGKNCSQAVVLAFCEEMHLSEETVSRQTIGFGGGMGRMREVCGTISGITYVISNLYGDKGKKFVYEMIQTAADKFRRENGSVVCRELLGLSQAGFDSPAPRERTNEYYSKRPCAELCRTAADILEDLIKAYESRKQTV